MNNKFSFYILFLLFAFVSISPAFAQKEKKTSLWKSLNTPTSKDTTADDYYGDNTLRYEDYVYKKNIKTVELRDESFILSKAICASKSAIFSCCCFNWAIDKPGFYGIP